MGCSVLRQLVSWRLGQRRLVLDRVWHRRSHVVRAELAVRLRLAYGTASTTISPPGAWASYSSWGLGSVANSWLYSGYTNPYYATVVAAQPAQTTIVYDYSQPINVTARASG